MSCHVVTSHCHVTSRHITSRHITSRCHVTSTHHVHHAWALGRQLFKRKVVVVSPGWRCERRRGRGGGGETCHLLTHGATLAGMGKKSNNKKSGAFSKLLTVSENMCRTILASGWPKGKSATTEIKIPVHELRYKGLEFCIATAPLILALAEGLGGPSGPQ